MRQVLDQELRRARIVRDNLARQARFEAGHPSSTAGPAPGLTSLTQFDIDQENMPKGEETIVKRDFFGRIIEAKPLAEIDRNIAERNAHRQEKQKVWVTFHEGLNNAVRKPITLSEFLKAL